MCLDCCHKRDFLSTSSALLEAEKCLHHSDIIRRRLLKQEAKRRLRAEAKAASETTNENKEHKSTDEGHAERQPATLFAGHNRTASSQPLALIQCAKCFYTLSLLLLILMYLFYYAGKTVGCEDKSDPDVSHCGLCFNCCQNENFCVSEEDKKGCAHHIKVDRLQSMREEKYLRSMNARNEKIREGNQAKVKKAKPPSANVKCERDSSFFLYYC